MTNGSGWNTTANSWSCRLGATVCELKWRSSWTGIRSPRASGFGRVVTPVPVATSVTAASTVDSHAGPAEIDSEPLLSTVLVLSLLPGTVSRALLLVPRPDALTPDSAASPRRSDTSLSHRRVVCGPDVDLPAQPSAVVRLPSRRPRGRQGRRSAAWAGGVRTTSAAAGTGVGHQISSPTSICHPSRGQISRGRTSRCPTSICLSWRCLFGYG